MRKILPCVAALASLAVALSPAAASAALHAPPKPPEAREAQRLFDSRGGARVLAQRVASVEEVAAIASATQGLTAAGRAIALVEWGEARTRPSPRR